MRARIKFPNFAIARREQHGWTTRRSVDNIHFSKEMRITATKTKTTTTTRLFSLSFHQSKMTALSFEKLSIPTRCCYFSSLQTSNDVDNSDSNDNSDYNDYDYDDNNIADDHDHDHDDENNTKRRIWLDPKALLSDRTSRFINQPLGSLHHLDIKLASVDLIRECGKLNSFEGMKMASDLLERMIEEKKHVNLEINNSSNNNNNGSTSSIVIVPDRTFKMVMYGWANICKKVSIAPQRMREVLDLMIQEAEYDKSIKQEMETNRIKNDESNNSGDDDNKNKNNKQDSDNLFEGLSCEPTVDIYNTLLQGLSQAASRSIQAAIEAEHALKTMKKMNRNRGWHTKPNTRSYSLVMNAYAKTKHVTAGERAESVLRKMIQCYEEEKEAYLEEYGVQYDIFDTHTNERNIVTPDTIAYSIVIQAYGQSDSDDAAGKALNLLNELINSDNPMLQPDAFAFANTINAFSRKAAKLQSPHARFEAAQQAEDILWMMVDEIKKRPQMEVTDDNTNGSLEDSQQSSNRLSGSIVPFNSCLNAWAQSFTRESPHRADDLLQRMLDPELQSLAQIYPNAVSFNTCMLAWSKSSKFEEGSSAPERAEELLNLLKEISKGDDDDNSHDKQNSKLRPDVRSYVTVMNAYAISHRKDSVFHTYRLLKDLIQDVREGYFDTGDNKDKINASPFTILFKAVANTKKIDMSSNELEDLAFGPLDGDEEELSEVIDPYSIALKTYSDLLKDAHDLGVRADHFAFSEMLAVVEAHTDAESIERRQRIEEIFHDACQAGHVSSMVVRAMQKACPNDIMLKDLLQLRGNDTVVSIESINRFPKQWTARVSQEFRRVSSRSEHFRKQTNFFGANNSKKNNNNSSKKKHSKKGPFRKNIIKRK